MALDEWSLTLQQRKFCEHYVANGGNHKQAALSAGYSKHSPDERAYEQLRKPAIRRYVTKLMKEAIEKSGFTTEYTLNLLKKGAEAAFKDKLTNLDGVTRVDTIVNYDGLEKCLDMRNRMVGDYAPEKTETKTENTNSLESATFRALMDEERKNC